MKFEWDEDKRQANIRQHNIDFLAAIEAFEGPLMTKEDTRFEYDEERYISFGLYRERVIVIIHTYPHENSVRLISVRKAKKYEQKIFYTEIGN